MNPEKKRAEIEAGFERIAKQYFGESAKTKWSDNDPEVMEIHTALTSVDAEAIYRFAGGNLKCWVTTNAAHEIIICRDTNPQKAAERDRAANKAI